MISKYIRKYVDFVQQILWQWKILNTITQLKSQNIKPNKKKETMTQNIRITKSPSKNKQIGRAMLLVLNPIEIVKNRRNHPKELRIHLTNGKEGYGLNAKCIKKSYPF